MASIYASRSGPVNRGLDPNTFYSSALDAPMSPWSTFWDQAKGGVLESFGLGTAIRDFSIPQGTEPRQVGDPNRIVDIGPLTTFQRLYEAVRGAVNPVDEDAVPISQEDWKNSPYYRENIPWDAGMTEDRAAALAMWDDARQVREYFGQKRPITSFLGNFAGQALDPINYIPITGPVVRAAAISKFGFVSGLAAVGALDAAANTAIFGLTTAEIRGSYGDEISWQRMVSEIAMSALIGAAFGGVVGAIGKRSTSRALSAAEAELSSLRNVQESRVAFNEAIGGLATEGEVRLTPNAVDPIARLGRQENPVFSPDLLTTVDQQRLSQSTAVARVIEQRSLAVTDFETFLRDRVLTSDEGLRTRYETAQQRFQTAQERVADLEQRVEAQTLADRVALIDEVSGERIRAIESELASNPTRARRQELETERAQIIESLGEEEIQRAGTDALIGPRRELKSARNSLSNARRDFSSAQNQIDALARQDIERNRALYQPATDASVPARIAAPEQLTVAQQAVSKSETIKQSAETYRVNPETGEYLEASEIDQLRAEGRLTDEDMQLLEEQDNLHEQALAYDRVLAAAVRCLL